MALGGHAECYDAELAALAMAANRASTYAREHPEINAIHIFSDCSSALTSILNRKPSAGQLFSATFSQTITNLISTNPTINITLSWCPSHSNIQGNDRADSLAKKATELALNAPINTTRTNALRRAKAITTKLWTQEWKKSALSGRFAIANRFPPSLSPSRRFTSLKNNRELFGRTVQCRTGHGYTGEFRRDFKLEGPYSCPCGEPLETREHIIRECPRYNAHRRHLTKISPQISLPTILGTKDGISALTEFLKTSGAFTRPGAPSTGPGPPRFANEPEPTIDHDAPSDSDED